MQEINNKQLRALWLEQHLLLRPPTGPLDVLQMVKHLGFVQIDTIQNVARAHHHIIWSRNQKYRSKMIDRHLGRGGDLFEHFTHDASMLPIEFFPMWQRRFAQLEQRVGGGSSYHNQVQGRKDQQEIIDRIRQEGPLSTEAFDTKIVGEKQMWSRPPHKQTLDYLWYAGVLTTSHRDKFRKFYDLMENVIPPEIRAQNLSDQAQIDWLCDAALERLGVASLSDIKKFWEAVKPKEVKEWAERRRPNIVRVQDAAGDWLELFASPELDETFGNLISPSSRMRLINPFDPAARERKRLARYFGFEYTIEIFVPEAKRIWGYYVYPLLQGDRFVGRIELRADRKLGQLSVVNFWQEGKVKWTDKRFEALEKELERFARFAGLSTVDWQCDRA